MSALTVRPRELPPIGQTRYARDIRTGWHVQLPDTGWRLVLAADRDLERVLLTVPDGLHTQTQVDLSSIAALPTRTPAEQIQFIEAQRIADSPQYGYGPVTRLHTQQQWDAVLGFEGEAS